MHAFFLQWLMGLSSHIHNFTSPQDEQYRSHIANNNTGQYISRARKLADICIHLTSSSSLVFCPRAVLGIWSLTAPSSPVSSFNWVLHRTPPGHIWCLPAIVFPTTTPHRRDAWN